MVLLILLTLLTLLLLSFYLYPIIFVSGNSMFPTFFDNDVIVGTRIYKTSNLKKNDIIVYKSPDNPSRFVIKRIHHFFIDNSTKTYYFYCLGDNQDDSYDSRNYGYISSDSIICKIITRRINKDVCNKKG